MNPLVRRSLRSGMITLIDSTKTTGLIFFPGTMVGMLLAGADPIDAVRLQLILLYALLGSVAIAALTATTLARRNFFTPAHQLREPPSPERHLLRFASGDAGRPYTRRVADDRRKLFTLIATILGSTIVFLDGTVVNVALPAISEELDAGLADQQWIVEAYLLATVSLLLVGGALGDQFGRRRIFIIGLIGFGITSVMCAVAPTTEMLIGSRALQGFTGALLVPGLAGDPDRDLRGPGARQGDRHLDRMDRDRDRGRAGRRRRAGRGALVAGDLLDQHPADHRLHHAGAGLRQGERRTRARTARIDWLGIAAFGDRAGRPRLRADRAAARGLGDRRWSTSR